MNITTIDPTTNKIFLLGRSMRFWLVIALMAVILLTIIIMVATTALVRVTYSFADQAENSDVTLYTTNAQGELHKLSTLGDFALIPRSTSAITAKTDSSETRAIITDLPLLSVPTFELVLEPQRRVSKIGAQTLGCNMTNQHGTFSYTCGLPSSLVKINRPRDGMWGTTEVPMPPFAAAVRYKDGFLGVHRPAPNEPLRLTYMVPGGNAQRFTIPSLQAGSEDVLTVVTDQSNSQTNTFAVINFTTGNYLIALSLSRINDAVQFSRTTTTDPQFNVNACALNNTLFACYYGPGTIDHANIQEHQDYRRQNPNGYIETRILPNTEEPNVYEMRGFGGAESIHITQDGSMFMRSGEGLLYTITTDGTRAKGHIVARDTNSANASGDSVFYTANNGVYEYTPRVQRTYLRFLSPHIIFPVVSTYGTQVLFNAFVQSDENSELRTIAHAYRLTDSPLQQGEARKEDFLPYEFEPPITYMDYSDDVIYVGLNPIFGNFQNGQRRIDEQATKAQEQTVRQRLQNDGLLNSGTTVIFKQ